jgi:hypothetical protein
VPAHRYLDVVGDITGQCHMQNYQGLPRGGAMRREVTSSVRPHAALHIHPVFHRMHSLRPEEKITKTGQMHNLLVEQQC